MLFSHVDKGHGFEVVLQFAAVFLIFHVFYGVCFDLCIVRVLFHLHIFLY